MSPSHSHIRTDSVTNSTPASAEHLRLKESADRTANWKRWGTYLSERQWGTVREDYSKNQDAWQAFPHDHARSRVYRWGEDGLLGWCDRQARLCFSFAFWNGRDPILKERLFGLTGPEGNHGEDVKELYFYCDASPSHAYSKAVYKYPMAEYPYDQLVHENQVRDRKAPEFELLDTGLFDNDEYFDCEIEYAKAAPDDCLMQLTVHNRSSASARLHVLSQFWARNTWIWGCEYEDCTAKPMMRLGENGWVTFRHQTLGNFEFAVEARIVKDSVFEEGAQPVAQEWLFTENETNPGRHPSEQPEMLTTGKYFKDAFHEAIVQGNQAAVNPKQFGTKSAAVQAIEIAPGSPLVVRCRLRKLSSDSLSEPATALREAFTKVMADRRADCDAFYAETIPSELTAQETLVARQAYAGLLWTKQFYHYVVNAWIDGDPEMKQLPEGRENGRNHEWNHIFNRDVISMPDKWEYPWYAAWDLAFHMLPIAKLDPDFAKEQLILFLREWYMHPNGQIPAYEWHLSDVNPPVHAWACWEVYQMCDTPTSRDKVFLARTFQKLTLNFTWWINRKDVQGRNVFAGGFLGLDNIGIFDRSKPMPGGGYLDQADGTAWMAFFCGKMLRMALELAKDDPAYGDMASKFFEHYVSIAQSMNSVYGSGLWDEADGFYYDQLWINNERHPMKIRSLVGLIPLFTNILLDNEQISHLPGFKKRMDWFLANRPELAEHMTYLECSNSQDTSTGLRLLAIPSADRFRRLLTYLLDENEFLSPFGIRSLSIAHEKEPFTFQYGDQVESVGYVPGESDSWMFGGNSNWRGPVWFPINYLIVEALENYYTFYGDEFLVECPTGSGNQMNLNQVSKELERRLASLFLPDEQGHRPSHGADRNDRFAKDAAWKDLVLFYEYFHADTGEGLGASHQTGWTALVATLLDKQRSRGGPGPASQVSS